MLLIAGAICGPSELVLYEAASGRLPFGGRTGFEISAAIMREIPAPLGPPVPPGRRAIIQRCLAKEPMQRYQRATEVQAALEAVQFLPESHFPGQRLTGVDSHVPRRCTPSNTFASEE